jgi:hypothetical protein
MRAKDYKITMLLILSLSIVFDSHQLFFEEEWRRRREEGGRRR